MFYTNLLLSKMTVDFEHLDEKKKSDQYFLSNS